MEKQNQAVIVFTDAIEGGLKIKFANAQIISKQYLNKYKDYTARFAILFEGHLQALRHCINMFANAFFQCETSEFYQAADEQHLDQFLTDLVKYLQQIKKIVWYEVDYKGKTMYKYKKPRSTPYEIRLFEGSLDIRCNNRLAECLSYSYYQNNKENIIKKSTEYYYNHQEEIKLKRRQEYHAKKQQAV